MTITPTASAAVTIDRKWRPPRFDCLDVYYPLLAEGRLAMQKKQFDAAAQAFRSVLLQLQEQPLPPALLVGDAWTMEEILISTRLFILRAVAASQETDATLVEAHALLELVVLAMTDNDRSPPAQEQVLTTCQIVAKILKEEHPMEGKRYNTANTTATTTAVILQMGILACSASLQLDDNGNSQNTFRKSPKQRRQFLELQSHFHQQLGDLEEAAAALEELLKELVATQGRSNSDTCPYRKRLRELHIRLDRIDVQTEDAEAREKKKLNQTRQSHKKRNRLRHRDKWEDHLTELAPRVEEICQLGRGGIAIGSQTGSDNGSFFQGLSHGDNSNNSQSAVPASPPSDKKVCTAIINTPLTIDWDSVPSQLAPGSSEAGGIRHHKDKRVRRKQRQLEALFVILKNLITRFQQTRKGNVNGLDIPIHIVDFGAGSGNSCLVFVWLLRNQNCRFTLVDNKSHAVMLGQQRTVQAGLPANLVNWVCGDVSAFDDAFDIGLATHLCGGGTDMAMAKCLLHKAAFLVTPCCLGKIKFDVNSHLSADEGDAAADESLIYPRSAWLRDHLSPDEYLEITRLGDNAGAVADAEVAEDGKSEKTWQLCLKGKALLDADRLELAREHGYETELGRLGSKSECGPKSDVLCGLCLTV